jgi:hypothetical protein
MTDTTFSGGCLEIPLTGALLFAGGEIAAVANPEGVPCIITDVKIYVDTPSTGAANINVGLAADAVTSDTDMINALAINGAITGLAYHGMTALAAKGAAQVWSTSQYLTATASADSSGFAGRLFVSYIPVR